MSSPKLTLHLSTTSDPRSSTDEVDVRFESWECQVCAYRNPPGLSPAAARICGLCGVPRSSVPSLQLSTSLPSSTASSPPPDTAACPVCTFVNHPSLLQCEMCTTNLPRTAARSRPNTKSAPSSRPSSPDFDLGDSEISQIIKISFRKGGDKAFYTILKRCLKSKAWEVPYLHLLSESFP